MRKTISEIKGALRDHPKKILCTVIGSFKKFTRENTFSGNYLQIMSVLLVSDVI